MTWPLVPLGEVARVVGGATPKTSDTALWGGDIPWVTPADLSRQKTQHVAGGERTITQAGLASCSAELLPTGSVLLSSRAPIGLVAITTTELATNQGFKSIVPGEHLHAPYAYHWLKSQTAQLNHAGSGATFKEISKRTVERFSIPLPPLAEQRRIAAILDQASSLRAQCTLRCKKISSLPSSIFDSMFPDETSYRTSRLGKFATLESGRNLVASETTVATPYHVLKISAVTSGTFKSDEVKALPSDYTPPYSPPRTTRRSLDEPR